jgi:hypothetical protein
MGRHGTMNNSTKDIIGVVANNRERRVSEVMLMHPNNETAQKMWAELSQMKKQDGKVHSNISRGTFDTLAIAFELCDVVFFAMDMDSNPEVEAHIIQTWKNRDRCDNRLVSLKGAPLLKGLSTQRWVDAELENYISPENIRDFTNNVKDTNRQWLAAAEQAIDFCVESRMEGKRPSGKKLSVEFLPDLSTLDC